MRGRARFRKAVGLDKLAAGERLEPILHLLYPYSGPRAKKPWEHIKPLDDQLDEAEGNHKRTQNDEW